MISRLPKILTKCLPCWGQNTVTTRGITGWAKLRKGGYNNRRTMLEDRRHRDNLHRQHGWHVLIKYNIPTGEISPIGLITDKPALDTRFITNKGDRDGLDSPLALKLKRHMSEAMTAENAEMRQVRFPAFERFISRCAPRESPSGTDIRGKASALESIRPVG